MWRRWGAVVACVVACASVPARCLAGQPVPTLVIPPPPGRSSGSFPVSLAVSGSTLIVGTRMDAGGNADPPPEPQGSVDLFDLKSGTLLQSIPDPAPPPNFYGYFGFS